MNRLRELQKLLSVLQEAAAIADIGGKLSFSNPAWHQLPSSTKELVECKLSEQRLGDIKCPETKISLTIATIANHYVAIVKRSRENLLIKDSILSMLLHGLQDEQSTYDTAATALGLYLRWRWALVTRFKTNNKVEVLSFWDTEKLTETFEYNMAQTPCEVVADSQDFTSFTDIPTQFAHDQPLIDMGVKVYAGYIYRDHNGEPLGHIFIMHPSDKVDLDLAEETLHLVSTIVGNRLSLNRSEMEVQKQKSLAMTDGLTKLCNRSAFDIDLSEEVRNLSQSGSIHFVLAIIDLDGMKKINDTLGHDEGDRLLRSFAEQLKKISRSQDHAYRLGGDEFALLFRNTSLEKETLLRERFKVAVGQLVKQGFEGVNASIGFVSSSEYPGD
ncbi:MAG: GGDEF domain-containing protein, partial [Kangiellaceae bacterium]|nr:GGDEF domain-containing protein [Kangiellaceae bacterium]